MSHINQLLLGYYQANGATSSNIDDAEREFLLAQGATPGQEQDMWYEFLRGQGYTGAMNDMIIAFYHDNGVIYTTVPDVVGQTVAAATTLLQGARLDVGNITGDTEPVVAQSPGAGTEAVIGSLVSLQLSVTVPNVVGMTQAEATAALEDADLTVGTVSGDVDPVIAQDPAASTVVNIGTAVDITLTANP